MRPLLVAAAVLWLYLGISTSWFPPVVVSVAWALLGAYLVPATLVYESARRRLPTDPVTTAVLIRAMGLGSLLAAAASATGPVAALVPAPPALRILAGALPPVVETVAVGVAVLIIGRGISGTPRTGLFLGGALGAGFAAFTALTAILQAVDALNVVALPATMPSAFLVGSAVTVQHAILAAVTSPVWGALVGAAVFGSRRALGATVSAVVLTHVLVDAVYVAAGGLLGTSPAALSVQLLLPIAVAAPAAVLWRQRTVALGRTPEGQRGGA